MHFVSYAQNFEDVMLMRALKDVSAGFYIDVGAADPTEYSVTRAFYDRGWHGINMEPEPAYFARLREMRPRDLNLNIAIGPVPGVLPLMTFSGTGLSTFDPVAADRARAAGFSEARLDVPVETLAEICRRHAPADIHFLKIDVEGAERSVLESCDFSAFRPWIVLLEATEPLTSTPAHMGWEPMLLEAGYVFVWFDGLNRFYVAQERAAALAPAFATPPNIFDSYTPIAEATLRTELQQAREAAEAAIAAERQATRQAEAALLAAREAAEAAVAAERLATDKAMVQLRRARRDAAAADRRCQAVQAERAQTEAWLRQAEARLGQAAELGARSEQAAEAIDRWARQSAERQAEIEALRRSHSWRLTGPLRAATHLARGQAGAALRELGLSQPRIERLRSVAGQDGGLARRGARLGFYGLGRAAARLPGARSASAAAAGLLPGPWAWLRARNRAYIASASASAAPAPAPPPPAMTRPASADPAYQAWIAAFEDHTPHAPGQAERPVLTILVAAGPDQAAALDRSLDALAAQTRGAWECRIAALPGLSLSPRWSSDARILGEAAAGPTWQALARLTQAAGSRHLMILEPGDVLAPGAIAAFAERLEAEPGLDLLHADEDVLGPDGLRQDPAFKPGWSPELLASYDYIGRPTALRTALVQGLGGLAPDLAEAAPWDLHLRVTASGSRFGRITRVLCHRGAPPADRPDPASPSAARFREAARRHWERQGIAASVATLANGTQHATWTIVDPPLVSIIIPNRNKAALLRVCLDGLLHGTLYPRREIIVVDNDSTEAETLALYAEATASGQVRIAPFPEPFNYSAACNAGARLARGSLLLFLNNDIEVTNPAWLDELVRCATRPGVGVVGTRLVYPDGGLQHAGVVVGMHLCGLAFRGAEPEAWGVFGSSGTPRNWSGVMGACQMIDRAAFDSVGGFDESYRISNSDVAISLVLRERGLRTVYTPFAQLTHHEGATRGRTNPGEDMARTAADIRRLAAQDDPCFHPGLSAWKGIPTLRLAGETATGEQARLDLETLLAPYPPPLSLDLFDDADVATALGAGAEAMLPTRPDAAAVVDAASAALFCIGLLRDDPGQRARFPHALSEGAEGAFAAWLGREGAARFGLTPAALSAIDSAFRRPPGARARQVLLMRPDLRAAFPLATLPAGRRIFLSWLVDNGIREYGLRPDEIWWFALACAEDPARELRDLTLLTPAWQAMFPDATTRFGQGRFAAWFRGMFGEAGDWTEAAAWPDAPTPAEEIRIAWHARPAWRRRFPDALESDATAEGLLGFLASADSGLPEALRAWCAALPPGPTAAAIAARGVNVISHFCYPSGLRTSAEAIVDGLRLADWAVTLRDVPVDRRKDDPLHERFLGQEQYDVTLIHVQPEPYFSDAHRLSGLSPRDPESYRIGYWYWEMDTIPEGWKTAALETDELWAATHFVGDALKARFDQPVFTLPPGISLAPFQRRARAHFGVPEKKFAFLFAFHMMSIMERKNPLGLIRAFAMAFGPDAPVVLVLKTTFGENHPKLMAELRAAAAAAPAEVIVIDQVYTQDETLALMEACDAYVSLHRSEGLGLTMAEAMLLAKPVIATRFSGNIDFMNDDTSLLVDCKVVEIGRSVPPYEAHMRWADPCEANAAHHMRRLFEDRAFGIAMGQRARADLEANLSPAAAGRRMADRLETIRENRRRMKRARLLD